MLKISGIFVVLVLSVHAEEQVCKSGVVTCNGSNENRLKIVWPADGSTINAYDSGIAKVVVSLDGKLAFLVQPAIRYSLNGEDLEDDPHQLLSTSRFLRCKLNSTNTVTASFYDAETKEQYTASSSFFVQMVVNPTPETDTSPIPIQPFYSSSSSSSSNFKDGRKTPLPPSLSLSSPSSPTVEWSLPLNRVVHLYAKYRDDVLRFRREMQEIYLLPHFVNRFNDVAGLRTHMHDPELELMYLRIREWKPHHLLEIGSYCGWSSCAWLIALRDNGFGHLYSVDRDGETGFVASLPIAQGRFTFLHGAMESFFSELSSSPDFDYYFLDGPHDFNFALRYLTSILENVRGGGVVPVQVHDAYKTGEAEALADWIMLSGRVGNVFSIDPLRSPASFAAFQKIREKAGIPISEDISGARRAFEGGKFSHLSHTEPPYTASPSLFFELLPIEQKVDFDPIVMEDGE